MYLLHLIILQEKFTIHHRSQEWLENNPEARGHGFVTGNMAAGIGTGNTAVIGPSQAGADQPLALVSWQYKLYQNN